MLDYIHTRWLFTEEIGKEPVSINMGTKIYNSSLTKELIEGARIAVATDPTPSEIAEKVIPVMEVNPKLLRITNVLGSGSSATSAATITALAADANNDIYLTSCEMTLDKDAICDASTSSSGLLCTVNGVASTLLSLGKITLTAQSTALTLTFRDPIKIDRNTTVRITMPTFSVGACIIATTVQGYRVHNVNA